MIEIKDLSVEYKGNKEQILALDELNINIDTGDIYTFIGPSGWQVNLTACFIWNT